MAKPGRAQLPAGWTRERLIGLLPQQASPTQAGFMPRPDDAARLELVRFLLRQDVALVCQRPADDVADEVAATTWRLVSRHYLSARYGANWPSYKAMGRKLCQRATDLYAATLAFSWSGRGCRVPSDVKPPDWARLASLLRRVNAEIEGKHVREPLPELDTEFFVALDLVRTRINIAAHRLKVAVAAIEQVRGRPQGSAGAELAKDLAALWAQFTGRKATVSSATGDATGPFVEYCGLAEALLSQSSDRVRRQMF